MKMGFIMNIACVLVQLAAIHTVGPLVFDLHQFPSWAAKDFGLTVVSAVSLVPNASAIGNDSLATTTLSSFLNVTLPEVMAST